MKSVSRWNMTSHLAYSLFISLSAKTCLPWTLEAPLIHTSNCICCQKGKGNMKPKSTGKRSILSSMNLSNLRFAWQQIWLYLEFGAKMLKFSGSIWGCNDQNPSVRCLWLWPLFEAWCHRRSSSSSLSNGFSSDKRNLEGTSKYCWRWKSE